MKNINPFIITGYESPIYFCDREDESNRIISSIKNNRNTTLISIRRMGKTALISHAFYHLQKEGEASLHYLDILPTTNLVEFTKVLANSVVGKFEKKPVIIFQRFIKALSHLRPKISIDNLTGKPALELDIAGTEEAEQTLDYIFEYLGRQDRKIVIAMDEFQQIIKYPSLNTEAHLRSLIQKFNQISFIFSGSNKHMLQSIFSDYGRPFYQSADILFLERIAYDKYIPFIRDHFLRNKFDISEEGVLQILDWTYRHTFFIQYVCNRLYAENTRKINEGVIHKVMIEILQEREPVYYNYRNLLTDQQFAVLKAIAKEGAVAQPTSKEFISKHSLSTASSVQTALQALSDKELVYEELGKHAVNDVFLSRWLERF
jgi:uncharacterized protein